MVLAKYLGGFALNEWCGRCSLGVIGVSYTARCSTYGYSSQDVAGCCLRFDSRYTVKRQLARSADQYSSRGKVWLYVYVVMSGYKTGVSAGQQTVVRMIK